MICELCSYLHTDPIAFGTDGWRAVLAEHSHRQCRRVATHRCGCARLQPRRLLIETHRGRYTALSSRESPALLPALGIRYRACFRSSRFRPDCRFRRGRRARRVLYSYSNRYRYTAQLKRVRRWRASETYKAIADTPANAIRVSGGTITEEDLLADYVEGSAVTRSRKFEVGPFGLLHDRSKRRASLPSGSDGLHRRSASSVGESYDGDARGRIERSEPFVRGASPEPIRKICWRLKTSC